MYRSLALITLIKMFLSCSIEHENVWLLNTISIITNLKGLLKSHSLGHSYVTFLQTQHTSHFLNDSQNVFKLLSSPCGMANKSFRAKNFQFVDYYNEFLQCYVHVIIIMAIYSFCYFLFFYSFIPTFMGVDLDRLVEVVYTLDTFSVCHRAKTDKQLFTLMRDLE